MRILPGGSADVFKIQADNITLYIIGYIFVPKTPFGIKDTKNTIIMACNIMNDKDLRRMTF